jgi:hypothetical protein
MTGAWSEATRVGRWGSREGRAGLAMVALTVHNLHVLRSYLRAATAFDDLGEVLEATCCAGVPNGVVGAQDAPTTGRRAVA